MRRAIALCAAGLVVVVSASAAQSPGAVLHYPIATRAQLVSGDCGCAPRPESGPELYAVPLPGRPLAVLLRPISEEEFGGFMVQAVDWQMIEAEILAAAVAWPSLTAPDVLGLPPEIRDHLRAAVNEISGFEVFTVAP
ncbi:MAG: hypothetical protein JSW65_08150 [Candidatus Bipolaricaulota bacterium]|nr:MAG: hypothetical protein JSW65_08150 [Candidatus Bipolaricaulota bacterium]